MLTDLNSSKIGPVIDYALDSLKVPGIALGITRAGKLVHTECRGRAAIDPDRSLTADQIFPIGSLSKSFGAAAILLLRDSGKLTLQQSPAEFVPELKGSKFWQATSLYKLLTMQSGLGEDSDGSWGEQHLHLNSTELSEIFAQDVILLQRDAPPFLYSNFGYMVLGRIISNVSGMDSRKFISENILAPLEMTETTWTPPLDKGDRIMQGYKREGKTFIEEEWIPSNNDGAVFGGMWSTLSDLAKWVDFFVDSHLEDSSSRNISILSKASRREMQQVRVMYPVPEPGDEKLPRRLGGYGFGIATSAIGKRWAFGHNGAVPGYGATMWWDPDLQVGVVGVANGRYAEIWTASAKVLEDLDFNPKSQTPAHELVNKRAAELLRYISGSTYLRDDSLFEPNFYLDNSGELLASWFGKLKTHIGNSMDALQINGLRGLSGEIVLNDEKLMTITVSPLHPGRIQAIDFHEKPATK